jgi:uncharacterized protein YodC (DUF2158 family)
MMDDKIYFSPGQIVTLRQDIPNKPKMLVYRVERSIIRNEDKNALLKGVKVRWFTENGFLQEAVFSTKDLVLVD